MIFRRGRLIAVRRRRRRRFPRRGLRRSGPRCASRTDPAPPPEIAALSRARGFATGDSAAVLRASAASAPAATQGSGRRTRRRMHARKASADGALQVCDGRRLRALGRRKPPRPGGPPPASRWRATKEDDARSCALSFASTALAIEGRRERLRAPGSREEARFRPDFRSGRRVEPRLPGVRLPSDRADASSRLVRLQRSARTMREVKPA